MNATLKHLLFWLISYVEFCWIKQNVRKNGSNGLLLQLPKNAPLPYRVEWSLFFKHCLYKFCGLKSGDNEFGLSFAIINYYSVHRTCASFTFLIALPAKMNPHQRFYNPYIYLHSNNYLRLSSTYSIIISSSYLCPGLRKISIFLSKSY